MPAPASIRTARPHPTVFVTGTGTQTGSSAFTAYDLESQLNRLYRRRDELFRSKRVEDGPALRRVIRQIDDLGSVLIGRRAMEACPPRII